MRREIFRNATRIEGVKPVPAQTIQRWGAEHGFAFPTDFIEFFTEFGGIRPYDEWGYQFIYEDDDRLDFGNIGTFFHFDPNVLKDSVPYEYRLRCKEHWSQRDLVPFAWVEANTHAVLDFRTSRDAPAVYNVDFFCPSKADSSRPNMTWLADSFTGFLDILEREEDYLARNPD